MLSHLTFGRKASYVCFLLAAIVLILSVLLVLLSLYKPATITGLNGLMMIVAGFSFRVWDAEVRLEQQKSALEEANKRLALYQRITR